ncbi:MAG: phosphate binding protein [Bacteroidota bacterium]|nr:phosphate binding protein [Bacteroidota bacterium]
MRQLFIALFATILLASCGNKPQGDNKEAANTGAKPQIKIDGSSTVEPISEAVAEDYKKKNDSVDITVGTSGTGGGFKKFGRNETDISDASRPITHSEDSICKAANIDYIELPIAYDGLAVVVNKDNTWLSKITVKELKKMWEPDAQTKIKKWSDVNPAWPKEEIHLFGPGTASGTYDYFTEAINGKSKSSRGDYTASEDDNVLVQGIAGDKYALGYFGLAYYEQNKDKLKVLPIDNEKKEDGDGAITPTAETVKNGTYQPLSRPLFIYVNKKSSAKNEVKAFVDYYLANGAKLAAEVGYVALPDEANQLVKQRWTAGTTGSLFVGKNNVGMKMEDLLKSEQTTAK